MIVGMVEVIYRMLGCGVLVFCVLCPCLRGWKEIGGQDTLESTAGGGLESPVQMSLLYYEETRPITPIVFLTGFERTSLPGWGGDRHARTVI